MYSSAMFARAKAGQLLLPSLFSASIVIVRDTCTDPGGPASTCKDIASALERSVAWLWCSTSRMLKAL